MKFWCHNCSKYLLAPAPCLYCRSEVVEEVFEEGNAANFIPYTIPRSPVRRTREVQIRMFIFNFDQMRSGVQGMAPQFFQKLQKKQVQECSVCQDSERKEGLGLPCGHSFHTDCIKPWLQDNRTCPCCRTQFTCTN